MEAQKYTDEYYIHFCIYVQYYWEGNSGGIIEISNQTLISNLKIIMNTKECVSDLSSKSSAKNDSKCLKENLEEKRGAKEVHSAEKKMTKGTWGKEDRGTKRMFPYQCETCGKRINID